MTYPSIDPAQVDELVRRAWEARKRSYSPYSRFAVGAAVLGRSGAIYVGTNVENSSFGLTCCAERVAMFCAISSGESDLIALALVTDSAKVSSPCGACRQVMSELGP